MAYLDVKHVSLAVQLRLAPLREAQHPQVHAHVHALPRAKQDAGRRQRPSLWAARTQRRLDGRIEPILDRHHLAVRLHVAYVTVGTSDEPAGPIPL